jgi:mannose-6-phosphate isomerase-like protein (cupin superfamily)
MVADKPPVKVGPGASIYVPADVYHSTANAAAPNFKTRKRSRLIQG